MARTLLIVEDNPGDIDLLRLAFADHRPDTVVKSVGSASEAIDVLAEMARCGVLPDLILLDVRLPDGGSEVLIEHLRTHIAYRDVRVTAMSSADPGRRTKRRLEEAGIAACIIKPLRLEGWPPFIDQVG